MAALLIVLFFVLSLLAGMIYRPVWDEWVYEPDPELVTPTLLERTYSNADFVWEDPTPDLALERKDKAAREVAWDCQGNRYLRHCYSRKAHARWEAYGHYV